MRTRDTYYTDTTCMREGSTKIYYSDGTDSPRATPVYFAWTEPVWPFSFEAVSDKVSGNTRDRWNDFEHYKRTHYPNRSRGLLTLGSTKYTGAGVDKLSLIFPPASLSNGYSPYFGSVGTAGNGLVKLYDPSTTQIIPDVEGLSSLVRYSLKAMLPGIRPQLSLINSVLELKDFKSLPKTLSRVKSILCKGKKTLRQILGGAADAYLQKEFNVMPLLSDIAGIRRALLNTKKQVDNLLSLERKKLTRHYYVELGDPYVYSYSTTPQVNQNPGLVSSICGGSTGGAWIAGQCSYGRRVRYSLARFHAEIEYTYYLTEYQRENAQILGLADSLGVNLNPSIIWNAIPWTFVVDWVLGVSQWLDQFKVRNLEPVTVIHRYLWSIDIQRDIEIDVLTNLNVGIPSIGSPRVRVANIIETAYKRKTRPVSLDDIVASGFSLKEFVLAGALVLSRRR